MKIEAIFVSQQAADFSTPYSLDEVMAIENRGLEGDRYALREGHWQKIHGIESKVRDVSFITLSGIMKAARRLDWDDDALELARMSRRNVVLDDGDLTSLINVTFRLGDSTMRGTGDCDPCARPNQFADGKLPRFSSKKGLQTQDGLRARVLESGLISVGNSIEIISLD